MAEAGLDAELINIAEQAPSTAELEQMLQAYSGEIRKLFNTSGMQYRELNMKERIPSMSSDEAIELLSQNGMLVKRPFLLTQGKGQASGIVGFKAELWEEALA